MSATVAEGEYPPYAGEGGGGLYQPVKEFFEAGGGESCK